MRAVLMTIAGIPSIFYIGLYMIARIKKFAPRAFRPSSNRLSQKRRLLREPRRNCRRARKTPNSSLKTHSRFVPLQRSKTSEIREAKLSRRMSACRARQPWDGGAKRMISTTRCQWSTSSAKNCALCRSPETPLMQTSDVCGNFAGFLFPIQGSFRAAVFAGKIAFPSTTISAVASRHVSHPKSHPQTTIV
jgi:ABC-type phosphate transport system permease subunit